MGNEQDFPVARRVRLAGVPPDVPSPQDVAQRVQEVAESLVTLLGRLQSLDPAYACQVAGMVARRVLAEVRQVGDGDGR